MAAITPQSIEYLKLEERILQLRIELHKLQHRDKAHVNTATVEVKTNDSPVTTPPPAPSSNAVRQHAISWIKNNPPNAGYGKPEKMVSYYNRYVNADDDTREDDVTFKEFEESTKWMWVDSYITRYYTYDPVLGEWYRYTYNVNTHNWE